MIDVAISWEDGEKKEGLVLTIANHMKKCFLNWNKDTVDDDVIFKHLFELSEGKLNLQESEEMLVDSNKLMQNNKRYSTTNKKSNQKKSNSNSRNNNRKRY
jgi:hypothetical protein